MTDGTLSTSDVPTLHAALQRFAESSAVLVDLRLSILDMDRRGQPTGAAAEHYERVRVALIADLQQAVLPPADQRRDRLATPSLFASWSASAKLSWGRALKTVAQRLRGAVDRSTSAALGHAPAVRVAAQQIQRDAAALAVLRAIGDLERYPFGTVQDYRTNDFIRAATEAERAASIAAARRDGGVGAIDDPLCPGRTIFVEE